MYHIKLAEAQPNNHSFSHQQSVILHNQPKHKKKSSFNLKPTHTYNNLRLKTDEKQPAALFKNEGLNSHAFSMHIPPNNCSVSKLNRIKQKSTINSSNKKPKKNKQTISVINLNKNIEDSKIKGNSTITKRSKLPSEFSQKIKEKVEDFKILSGCLQQYVREQRKNSNEANLNEIIKLIGAFNRSQIAPISKPLQTLINDIVQSIQNSLPPPQLKSILKKSITFDSPSPLPTNLKEQVIETVKKRIEGREYTKKNDDKKLDQNLGRLKYESNRLKYFLEQISLKGQGEIKKKDQIIQKKHGEYLEGDGKQEQLNKLKQIAKQQVRMIHRFEDSSDQDTYRSDTQN